MQRLMVVYMTFSLTIRSFVYFKTGCYNVDICNDDYCIPVLILSIPRVISNLRYSNIKTLGR